MMPGAVVVVVVVVVVLLLLLRLLLLLLRCCMLSLFKLPCLELSMLFPAANSDCQFNESQ